MEAASFEAGLRRINRNSGLLALLVLAAAVALAGSMAPAMRAAQAGARDADDQELVAATRPGAAPVLLRVRPEASVKLGEYWERGESETRERVTAIYLLTRVGDHALLVTAPMGTEQAKQFIGSVRDIPLGVQRELLAPLRREEPEIARMLLPRMLDSRDQLGTEVFFFWGGVALAAFAAGWLALVLRRGSDLTRHPSARVLARYGGVQDELRDLEADLVQSGGGRRVGPGRFGSRWLVFDGRLRCNALPLREVVWAHKRITRHTVYFVPVAKNVVAVIHDSGGRKIEADAKERDVDALLTELGERCPWAALGYTREFEKAICGKQRQTVVAQILARRDGKAARAAAPAGGSAATGWAR